MAENWDWNEGGCARCTSFLSVRGPVFRSGTDGEAGLREPIGFADAERAFDVFSAPQVEGPVEAARGVVEG